MLPCCFPLSRQLPLKEIERERERDREENGKYI